MKMFESLSFKSKYSFPVNFFDDLDKFGDLKPQKEKKTNVYNAASELFNDLLETCFDEFCDLSDAKRIKIDSKYNPANLTIDGYDYNEWYKVKSGEEKELENLPPLEGDEEKHYSIPCTPILKGDKKEERGLKISTSNKILTRLPILLAQIRTRNNPNKLKKRNQNNQCNKFTTI